MGLATFMYADDNEDRLPYAWWYDAADDDANVNNFHHLLMPYLKASAFEAGTLTVNSGFAADIYPCPVRIRENHWRNIREFQPGMPGNPWKISYGMSQYALRGYPPRVTSPETVKLGAIPEPAKTLLVVDISHELNHPAVSWLGQDGGGWWHIGYKHGAKAPEGKANLAFMEGHVGAFSVGETNHVILNFKEPSP